MNEALSTTIAGMLTLLAAALLSAAIMGGFSTDLKPPPPVNPLDVRLQAEAADIETIDTTRMREIVSSGSHLILDARPQSEYDQGHIPTALPVPVRNFEESFPMIAPLLDPETPVVVYCTGPACDDGLRLIERMREAGYLGGVLYVDGMEGWSE